MCISVVAGARCDKGGNLIKAFNFIEQEGGVDTEASYPYESQVT